MKGRRDFFKGKLVAGEFPGRMNLGRDRQLIMFKTHRKCYYSTDDS